MKEKTLSSELLWKSSTDPINLPSLQQDTETQVCVIGGGIAGLTTAYLLAAEGKKVILIEAREIGIGETGRTTAHFFPPDEWYRSIENTFGLDQSILMAESFTEAIDLVESIIQTEHIDCAFERLNGYLYSLSKDHHKEINEEYLAAGRAGLMVEKLDQVPGIGFQTGPCVQFSNQAQFHPLKYLNGLTTAFIKKGGRIYCNTPALAIESKEAFHFIRTNNTGTIKAETVVVATHTPFNDTLTMHTKQAAYMTYVLGIQIPRGSVPRILMWDTGDPYYYLRIETLENDESDCDLLIVGGKDHRTGQEPSPELRYKEIEDWVRQRFPMALSVKYRWSGEIMEPVDGLAFLGHNPLDDKNIYIITGDSGNGMTHCTIGAMIINDLVMGRPNPWASLYDPTRTIFHGIKEFVSAQANTLAQYSDWLKTSEVSSIEQIEFSQGAIVQDGLHKLAVYKDKEGKLYILSPKCPHLGCIVHFNSAEKSWDCPCHGSRFDIEGNVLHGPAAEPLESIKAINS